MMRSEASKPKRDVYTTKITLASHMRGRGGTSDGDTGHGHGSGLDFMDSYTDTEYSYQKNRTMTIIALIVAIVVVAAILGAIMFSMFVFSESSNIIVSEPTVLLDGNHTLTPAQSLQFANKWLLSQQDSEYSWSNTPQALIAIRLGNPKWFLNQALSELSIKQMSIDLLDEMLKGVSVNEHEGERYTDFKMSTGDLATYMNAMAASCIDLNNFHGYSMTRSLHHAIRTFPASNDKNYYYYSLAVLAFCNAGERGIKDYIDNIKAAQQKDGGYKYGIDTTSMVVVALSCLSSSKQRKTQVIEHIQDAVNNILHQQKDDGSFGNLLNTANALQALLATNKEWDSTIVQNALSFITSRQKRDGSFGSVSVTAQIIPVLAMKTFADIRKVAKCEEETPTYIEEPEVLIKVFLSVTSAIGNDSTITPMMYPVTTEQGSTLYDVLVRAKEQHHFSFITREGGKWGHPIVGVNGLTEDVEDIDAYWAICIPEDAETSLGLDDVIPQDGDKIFLVYTRTVNT
ncbi:cobalamin binding intrinsic factor-like [Saccoglossus kowalevskii]